MWPCRSHVIPSSIQDADGFALAPWDGPWGRQFDRRAQVEGVLELLQNASFECFAGGRILRNVFRYLYPHAQVILMVSAGAKHELVVGFDAVDAQQGVFDL